MKINRKSVMVPLIIMTVISLLCLINIQIGGKRLQLASFTLIVVGLSVICNKLCNNNCIDDVFVTSRNYGWNTCRKCIDINPDAVLWG